MRFQKSTVMILLVLFLTNTGAGSTELYLFGKGQFIGKTGSESDYKEGENDFPAASPFSILGFGFGLTTGIYPAFFGIEAHYNLSGTTTLTDPSDNDTVKINTYRYASGFVVFGIHVLKSRRMSLFMNTGAGISTASNAELRTYTSEYGYETEIEPPEKKYPLTAFAGLGLKMKFRSFFGLLINTRYQYMDQKEPQSAFCITAGIFYSF
ncbi:MAG: hypothetical protein GF421_10990 [Candidatus Aminicenantes bacterium]|nr:hypothetical protein [Candidatus Aminicenantes bacterium]